ncbi:MAG: fused MFS/spermidine synthase [Pseudomonadaceae bacterium]|nr:fused MFS/spermidine synthase [Pseudomonadaceae bacterium]
MTRWYWLGITLAALMILTSVSRSADAKIVHRERSLYSTVLVNKTDNILCLAFSIKRDQRNQSCIDTRAPRDMVFSYTRMMMATLLFNPEPRRVLVIGLGGGTLPSAIAELYPDVIIDAVEIDSAVVEVARNFFNYRPHPGTSVTVADGRLFVKRRASLRARQEVQKDPGYDLVLLDAFNGDYIPEHMMTREFLTELRSIMSDDGILAANTFALSDLYHHESATYASVFGQFHNFRLPETGNRVIITGKDDLPNPVALADRAAELDTRLSRYGIFLTDYLELIEGEQDWKTDARVLTDQYSPANLLQGAPR